MNNFQFKVMKRKLLLPEEFTPILVSELGVNKMAISRAFRFVANSERANEIRRYAIERYGAIEWKYPNVNIIKTT